MELQYKYTPNPASEIPELFRCRVPLPGTLQGYLMNGLLREEIDVDKGNLTITAGEDKGYLFKISPGVNIPETLQIISIRDSNGSSELNYSNAYHFGENSFSNLLLCAHTLTMDEFKTVTGLEIKLDKGAKANIVLMQNEHNLSSHTADFKIIQAAGSTLKINIVSLHGGLQENIIDVRLEGSDAVCELNGIYLVDGKQVINTKINMHHLVPGCKSNQLFKGILDNEAKALFSGKINVAKDAQKTEAYQANHNLLLSRSAKVYAQPQLEIYADDVKCSHGATSGRLDEMALFYMRSRGIGMAEAKLLQQIAFVYDVLEKIDNLGLRDRLLELVESRLRGEFAHCANCSMNCC